MLVCYISRRCSPKGICFQNSVCYERTNLGYTGEVCYERMNLGYKINEFCIGWALPYVSLKVSGHLRNGGH